LNHIRGASSSEKAGGYTESMACQRAIQEAFDGLFIWRKYELKGVWQFK